MKLNPIILLLLLLFLSSQCTIQKRVYRPGWHISRKSSPKQLASKNEENQFKAIQENHDDDVSSGKAESGVVREIDTIFELPIQARVEESQSKDSIFSSMQSSFGLSEGTSPTKVKLEQKVSRQQKKMQSKQGFFWTRIEKLISILVYLVLVALVALYFHWLILTSTVWGALFLLILGVFLLSIAAAGLIAMLFIPTEEYLAYQHELKVKKEIERQKQREIEQEKQRELEKQLEIEREKQRLETGQPENEVDSTIQPNDTIATPKGQLSSTAKSVIAVIGGFVLIGLFYLFLN